MRAVFKAMARTGPPDQFTEMKSINAIAKPGVAESMLDGAGFELVERGTRITTLEWPDDEIAWRAMASVGPIVPSIDHSGEAAVREALLAAIAPFGDGHGGYRLRNDHAFVIARRRADDPTPAGDRQLPAS
jgi:hypothetical protein